MYCSTEKAALWDDYDKAALKLLNSLQENVHHFNFHILQLIILTLLALSVLLFCCEILFW